MKNKVEVREREQDRQTERRTDGWTRQDRTSHHMTGKRR